MTRETKIGLLVGLAFIIVIGILLSDHINSSTDPLPAAMGQTFNTTRQGVAAPDQREAGTVAVVTPSPIIPQDVVPTQREPLPAANAGSTVINIGPGGDPSALRPANRPEPTPDRGIQVLPPEPGPVATNDPAPNVQTPEIGVSNPMKTLIEQHPGDLAPIGQPPVGIAPTPGAGRQVKAEEGDTVTKLAAKYMGANTRANREAIIKANPSMTADGHLVIAGRTYVIPAAAGAPPARAVAVAPTPAPRVAPAPAPARAPEGNMYTVKDSDSLWKIASEQLGSGTRWTEIRDLNQDVLKGSEQVHVNMRLRLPAKTVASTN